MSRQIEGARLARSSARRTPPPYARARAAKTEALAQPEQKYSACPGASQRRATQTRRCARARPALPETLAGVIADAVESGTVGERSGRADSRATCPAPALRGGRVSAALPVRGCLAPGGGALDRGAGAREGPPAVAYVRLPLARTTLCGPPTPARTAYECWQLARPSASRPAPRPSFRAPLDPPLALALRPPESGRRWCASAVTGCWPSVRVVAAALLDPSTAGPRGGRGLRLGWGGAAARQAARTTRRGLYRAASRIPLDCDPRASCAGWPPSMRGRGGAGWRAASAPGERSLALALFARGALAAGHRLGESCTSCGTRSTPRRSAAQRMPQPVWHPVSRGVGAADGRALAGGGGKAKVNKDVEARRRESESRSQG